VGEASPTLELSAGTTIHIGFSGQFAKPYILESLRAANRGVLISIRGITTPEAAAGLREEGVFIEESLFSTGNKDEYFTDDILGCAVIEQSSGKLLGTITDVWIMPANDVWVVTTVQGEVPLPVIDDVIKRVDIAQKRIEVFVLDGLMELAGGIDATDTD
jgi:16S rRNA processing protein RimM